MHTKLDNVFPSLPARSCCALWRTCCVFLGLCWNDSDVSVARSFLLLIVTNVGELRLPRTGVSLTINRAHHFEDFGFGSFDLCAHTPAELENGWIGVWLSWIVEILLTNKLWRQQTFDVTENLVSLPENTTMHRANGFQTNKRKKCRNYETYSMSTPSFFNVAYKTAKTKAIKIKIEEINKK